MRGRRIIILRGYNWLIVLAIILRGDNLQMPCSEPSTLTAIYRAEASRTLSLKGSTLVRGAAAGSLDGTAAAHPRRNAVATRASVAASPCAVLVRPACAPAPLRGHQVVTTATAATDATAVSCPRGCPAVLPAAAAAPAAARAAPSYPCCAALTAAASAAAGTAAGAAAAAAALVASSGRAPPTIRAGAATSAGMATSTAPARVATLTAAPASAAARRSRPARIPGVLAAPAVNGMVAPVAFWAAS
jgi:hypothetical protein